MAKDALATAWLQIVPTLDGAGKIIEQGFTSQSKGVGQRVGQQIGDDINASASKGINRLGGAFKDLAGVATGALAAVSFGSLISGAVQASDATKKFASTLQFAGKGQGEIAALTKSVQAYADQTVYDLGDIQSMTAQLASNGVPDFERLAEAAGNLNAVAGGNAETFKSVGMVMTQTAGAGKLTTENWNQLADAIPGASGKLQEAMKGNGAYTGNFRDAMAEGQITAEEFNKAVMDLGLTDVAQQAATSTSTFEGAMGNLQAAAEKLTTGAITLIAPAITGAMNAASDAITGVTDKFNALVGFFQTGEFTSAVSDAFGGATEDSPIAGLLFNIRDGVNQSIEYMRTQAGRLTEPLQAAFDNISPAIGPITDAVGALASAAAPLLSAGVGPWTDFLSAILPGASGVISTIAGAVGQIAPLLPQITTPLGAFAEGVGGVLADLVQALMPPLVSFLVQISKILSANAPAIQQIVQLAGDALLALLPAIQQIGSMITDQILPALTPLLSAVADLIGTLLPPLLQAIRDIIPIITQVVSAVIEAALPVIQSIMDYVGNLIGVLTGIITFLSGVFSGDWSRAWDGIQQIARACWDGLKALVGGAINAIRGIITGGLELIKGSWQASWMFVRDVFAQLWEGIKQGAQAGIDTVVGFVQTLPQRIGEFFSGAGDWLVGAGRAILQGLLNGLQQAWSGVTSFVGGIGDWIVAHKGPINTDRQLLVPAGIAIMGGLADGMRAGFASQVQPFVQSVAGQITSTLEGLSAAQARAGEWDARIADQALAGDINILRKYWQDRGATDADLAEMLGELANGGFDEGILLSSEGEVYAAFSRLVDAISQRGLDLWHAAGDPLLDTFGGAAATGWANMDQWAASLAAAAEIPWAAATVPSVSVERTASAATSTASQLTKADIEAAVLAALQAMPDMRLRLDSGVMAGELAPALEDEFASRGYRGL